MVQRSEMYWIHSWALTRQNDYLCVLVTRHLLFNPSIGRMLSTVYSLYRSKRIVLLVNWEDILESTVNVRLPFLYKCIIIFVHYGIVSYNTNTSLQHKADHIIALNTSPCCWNHFLPLAWSTLTDSSQHYP